MTKPFLLKIHKSYRWVVAICDKDIYGQKLEDGNRELNLTTQFFQGEEMSEKELLETIKRCVSEDATFNIVGKKSIEYLRGIGFIQKKGISYIQDVPFALILL